MAAKQSSGAQWRMSQRFTQTRYEAALKGADGEFIDESKYAVEARKRQIAKNERAHCNIASNIYNVPSATCFGYSCYGCGNSKRRRGVATIVGSGIGAKIYPARVGSAH